MLSNLKETNKNLYYTLVCGLPPLVLLGLGYMFLNKENLCGCCSKQRNRGRDCCEPVTVKVVECCKCCKCENGCGCPLKEKPTSDCDNCDKKCCDPCKCDPCKCCECGDECKCDPCECCKCCDNCDC